jgi:hypothetical protein
MDHARTSLNQSEHAMTQKKTTTDQIMLCTEEKTTKLVNKYTELDKNLLNQF